MPAVKVSQYGRVCFILHCSPQENPPGAAEALRKERLMQGGNIDDEKQFLMSGKFNASDADASFKFGKSSAKFGGDSAAVGLSSRFKATTGAVPSVAREMPHTTQPPTLEDINSHLMGVDDDEG